MTAEALFQAIAGGRIRRDERPQSPADLLEAMGRDAFPWGRGDRVAVVAERGTAQLAAVLSIWASGAVPVLGASDADLYGWRGSGALWRWPDELLGAGGAGDAETAFIHRSSGSTGTAKFARRSFASLLREADGYRRCYGFLPGERAVVAAPIEHSFGFGAAFGLLSASAEIELPRFSPRALARRLTDGRTDIVVLTPPMAQLALQAAPARPPARSARSVIAGAGPISAGLNAAFQQRYGVAISRNYGSSETGATLGLAGFADETVVGAPLALIRILSPLAGEIGELVLDLGTPILGYENMPREADRRAARWRTGDLVSINPAGRVVLHGRLDDRVKVNGRLVDFGALARAARAVAGVRDAAALAQARQGQAEIADIVVFCEGRSGLSAAVQSALGGAGTVRMLATMPRTAAGKPDKARLRQMLAKGRAPARLGAER